MLSLTNRFLNSVQAAGGTPAAAFGQTAQVLSTAFGLTDPNAVTLAFDPASHGLTLSLNLRADFAQQLNLDFDLAALLKQAGLDNSALQSLAKLADVSGGTKLDLAVYAKLLLVVHIPLPGAKAAGGGLNLLGSKIELGASIYGQKLSFVVGAGAVQLGIQGGSITLDADAQPGRDGTAKLVLEDKLEGWTGSLVGGFDIRLPLAITLNNRSYELGVLTLATNPANGSNGLAEWIRKVSGKAGPNALPALVFTAPDFEGMDSRGALLLELINNPTIVLDGIDFGLGAVQDLFESSLASDVPLIGDKLRSTGEMIGDLRGGLLLDLRQKLQGDGKLVETVRSSLFTTFTQMGILQDGNHDGSVTLADIDIAYFDAQGHRLAAWVAGAAPPKGVDALEVNMDLGGHLITGGVEIPLDFKLPGVEFSVDGGFAYDIAWHYAFGFGISQVDRFFLVTAADSRPELSFLATLYLDGSPKDPNLATPLSANGRLLFLDAKIADRDTRLDLAGFQPSGIVVDLQVDLIGNAANRLLLNALLSNPTGSLKAELTVHADMRLGLELSMGSVGWIPKLRGDLVMDWDWTTGGQSGIAAPAAPSLSIENLRIDVQSFLQDFLAPIADKVAATLEPIRPIVETLTKPIGGLDELLSDPTLRGLINKVIKLQGGKAINWAFLDAAKTALELPQLIAKLSGNGGEILLGSIRGLGTSKVSYNIATMQDLLGLGSTGVSLGLDPVLSNKLLAIESASNGGVAPGSSSVSRSGFQWRPYILDLGNWAKIFSGGSATLFTYEMPLLNFAANFDVTLAKYPLGPLRVGVAAFGSASATIDLAFGFDTYGIQRSISTGNYLNVLDGFYVSDFSLPQFLNGKPVPGTGGLDKPEVLFNLAIGLRASVDVLVVEGGLTGEVDASISIDFNDIPTAKISRDGAGQVANVEWTTDGKVRGSEIATMLEIGRAHV
jgi:hypothetical protein